MFYPIDPMEFLSLVAVAAFGCKNRSFYLYYFSFYFQLFSCSVKLLANFGDFIARYFGESQVLEILLFHFPKLNVSLAIIIIIDYYSNSFVNCYWSKLKYLVKSHCFALGWPNHEMLQPDAFSYSTAMHYPCLLCYLFDENGSIRELLNVRCCYY